MEKKKYYAITTLMTFEKTVLVPVDSVQDIDEAMDLVECGVEVDSISLYDNIPNFETKPSPYADSNGVCEFTDSEAGCYQIVERDE